MPEKTVYTITDKGRERFAELMDEAAALPARVDFGFLPVLANISLVDQKTGRALIDELIETHRSTAERVDGAVRRHVPPGGETPRAVREGSVRRCLTRKTRTDVSRETSHRRMLPPLR